MVDRDRLHEVFESARRLGFLGPRPVAEQVAHSLAVVELVEAAGIGPARFVDLGSGGGLPGLVLAAAWPDVQGTLLDVSQQRTAFLRRTLVALGWEMRLTVAEGPGEALARDPDLRAGFPLVVARSFAAPAVTAEIGGAFVADAGALAVSEPPDDQKAGVAGRERWPAAELARLGLGPATVHRGDGAQIAALRRVAPLEDRWPRGAGTPAKRPLW